VPFAAALLARVPTALLGSNPQRLNSGRLLIRIFSLKTCAAHITHEGHLAAFLIDAHDAASPFKDRFAASTDSDSGDATIAQKQPADTLLWLALAHNAGGLVAAESAR